MVCRKRRGLTILAICAALSLAGCMINTGADSQFEDESGVIDRTGELSTEGTTGDDIGENPTETEEQEPTTEEETTEAVDAQKIVFSEKSLDVEKGEELTLELSYYPENANRFGDIIWDSVFDDVLEVNDKGTITAIGNGMGMILARMDDSVTVCRIQVHTSMKGIALSQNEMEIDREESPVLTYSLLPADTTEAGEIIFGSSDPSIVTVEPDGTLHPVSLGTAEITVISGEFSDTCKVEVVARLKGLEAENTVIELQPGQTGNMGAFPQPIDTTDEVEITYTSSNPAVATVNESGEITAVDGGNAVITASCGEYAVNCEVRVVIPLTGFALEQTSLAMTKGTTAQLTPIYAPANTTVARTPVFTSSNGNVVVVDGNGVLTAVGAGNAVITAQLGSYSATCSVSVTAPLQRIGLDKVSVTVWRGSQAALTVGYDPWDTTDDRSVVWSVDNPAVATVSNGVVTGVSVGTCVVTATVGGKSASCTVTVEEPSSDIILVFDPGHGGIDPGAQYYSLQEKVMTLKVALYCKAYLEEHYNGVRIYMTRTTDTRLQLDETGTDLRARCQYAASVGARAMISFHFNATAAHASQGAMAMVSKQPHVAGESAGLANQILAQLAALGLNNRGLLIANSTEQFDANGNPLDYYAINRHCAALGIPGIIIEHCFMDNAHDVAFCDSEEDWRRLGEADAIGIANYFGLPAK